MDDPFLARSLTEDMPQIVVRKYIKRDPDGSLVDWAVRKYDAEGREIETTRPIPEGERVYLYETTDRLTDTGREHHEVSYDPEGNVLSSGMGRFDDQNRVVETISRDEAGSIIDHQIWHYLDDQDAIHYIRYWPSGAVREEWTRGGRADMEGA